MLYELDTIRNVAKGLETQIAPAVGLTSLSWDKTFEKGHQVQRGGDRYCGEINCVRAFYYRGLQVRLAHYCVEVLGIPHLSELETIPQTPTAAHATIMHTVITKT